MPFEKTKPLDGLATNDFILRPIVASDAELDHAAVMASRDYLRAWEQSEWPEDDFTVAANRKDLEGLEQRHADRKAFTYTVMNPTETECLGCVYIIPPDSRMFTDVAVTPVDDHRWDDYNATVYYWVSRPYLGTDTDRALLDELRRWLGDDWGFLNNLFITNEQFTQQVDLIESAGLRLRFTFHESGKPGAYRAYE